MCVMKLEGQGWVQGGGGELNSSLDFVVFFISVWNGSKRITRTCKSMLRNFQWVGGEHHIKAKINCMDYYVCNEIGRLGLIGPKEALSTILCKWVLKAMETNDSNFKSLFRLKLEQCVLFRHKKWTPNLIWAFTTKKSCPF